MAFSGEIAIGSCPGDDDFNQLARIREALASASRLNRRTMDLYDQQDATTAKASETLRAIMTGILSGGPEKIADSDKETK